MTAPGEIQGRPLWSKALPAGTSGFTVTVLPAKCDQRCCLKRALRFGLPVTCVAERQHLMDATRTTSPTRQRSPPIDRVGADRSEQRRVGKGGGSPCRSRGSTEHSKKKKK